MLHGRRQTTRKCAKTHMSFFHTKVLVFTLGAESQLHHLVNDTVNLGPDPHAVRLSAATLSDCF